MHLSVVGIPRELQECMCQGSGKQDCSYHVYPGNMYGQPLPFLGVCQEQRSREYLLAEKWTLQCLPLAPGWVTSVEQHPHPQDLLQ